MASQSGRKVSHRIFNDLLREGIEINPEDTEKIDTAKLLSSKGLAHLKPRYIVKCVNEGDEDYVDLGEDRRDCNGELSLNNKVRNDGYGFCPVCGREIQIEGKQEFKRFDITLDRSAILNYVYGVLTQCCSIVKKAKFDFSWRNSGVFNCKFNSNEIIVCILDICTPDFLFKWPSIFSNPIFFIILNDTMISQEQRRKYIFTTLGEILARDDCRSLIMGRLRHCIEYAKQLKRKKPDFYLIERKFDEFIKKITPDQFESFVSRFMEERIHAQSQKTMEYQRKLIRDKGTIFGAFHRKIGGRGYEDLMAESKYDYLQLLFKDRKSVEIKKYLKSEVDYDDLKELIAHCERLDKDGILVTSTSKISPTVWAEIQQTKSAKGYWKYIIIDKPLLMELLYSFRSLDMLK